MTRHRLIAFALLAAVPFVLSATSSAAPKDRFETVVKEDSPAAADKAPAAPPVHERTAAGGPHRPLPDDYVKVPMIEGAGGPHQGKHKAPHGGALVPIGESTAHLEFVLNPGDGLLTMYVLDGEAQNPLYLPQELVFIKLAVNGEEFPIVLFQQDDTGTVQRPDRAARYAASHKKLEGVDHFDALIEGMTFGEQSYHRIAFPYPGGTE